MALFILCDSTDVFDDQVLQLSVKDSQGKERGMCNFHKLAASPESNALVRLAKF